MATIAVGKRYVTHAGNTVEIVEKYPGKDKDGKPVTFFTGNFADTAKGWENLKGSPNNVARWTSDGRWWPKHMPDQPEKSVHDLHEELGQ